MEFQSIAIPCISSGASGVPVNVCSEAIVTAVKEFGSQRGQSLSRIILIDNSEEVVGAMHVACERLLRGISIENHEPLRGATAGAPGDGVHLEIIQGTIETQQVDAVVSPMVGLDPLSTRVGNSLLNVVGSQLTARFRKEAGHETQIGDTVLVEGLPGLPSNAVFFLGLIPWDDDQDGTAVQVLRLGINNILTSCESRGFTSVAFPVLGAGIALNFPDSVVARILLEEVHVFKQTRDSRTPLLVRIVIHPNDEESSEEFESVQKAFQLTGFKNHVHQTEQGAVGAAAAATAGEVGVVVAGVFTVAAAATGGAVGGMIGYDAAEEAESLSEAAEMAYHAGISNTEPAGSDQPNKNRPSTRT
ncbi:Poly [ADP-ribose] polymerase 9 [Larimichthys crocea]|uniref:Uncharacterized protein n=1 Tax=Larimichthys crocea TaxID=215358 RepID=A0ACD3Q645_LARCR|nr:Poly [ADP-ribose] polymerase 9 [Larimichthys crocea]